MKLRLRRLMEGFLISRRNEVTKNMKLDYTFDRQLELEREDAREEGREEGQQLVNQLITLLLSDGRTEDLKKSASDKEYQLRLLKEYGLV